MATEEKPTPQPEPTPTPDEEEEEAPTEPGQAAEGEDFTSVPNEIQQPTPAGNEFAQEGGPTVQDQAVNAANNELEKQKAETKEKK